MDIIKYTKTTQLKTITHSAIQEITDWMPEVNRAVTAFGKQNSQTTLSLMTMGMLEAGPYRVLRQILAQVEKKRSALNDAAYKLRLKEVQVEELADNIPTKTGIELKRAKLKKEKLTNDINLSQTYIEGAVRELGALKRMYEEVSKNNNIPENWDEQDFEEAEIEHHIKCIFRNAIRDLMSGPPNHGTMEYMEQFGINPVTAYALTRKYLNDMHGLIQNDQGPGIQSQYAFYDEMYETFKNDYRKAAARIGLDHIRHADFLMKESK